MMTNQPPIIPSEGDNPTAFGEPGPPSPGRIPSEGTSPTNWADNQLQQFLGDGTEMPPDMLDEQKAVLLKPGDVVNDRFEVVRQLGFGGMGAVYHVKDRITGQDRALKVMLPSLLKNDAARQRFVDEVAISQKLAHEGVVRVYDLGEDRQRGIRFFTMEHVRGRTLHRMLYERGGKLPLNEALHIARQLCRVLEYAHRYTVHRDLKPQNIMVKNDGTIKVLDFGLAKLMSPGRLTKSSMALGTAYYQAPEQSVKLAKLDQRADIYSVGVILYQMLTGEMPIGRFELPSELVPELDPALDDIVVTCLQRQPRKRYRNAAEVLKELVRAMRAVADAEERADAVRKRVAGWERLQEEQAAVEAARLRTEEERQQEDAGQRRRQQEAAATASRRRAEEDLRQREAGACQRQEGAALGTARRKADAQGPQAQARSDSEILGTREDWQKRREAKKALVLFLVIAIAFLVLAKICCASSDEVLITPAERQQLLEHRDQQRNRQQDGRQKDSTKTTGIATSPEESASQQNATSEAEAIEEDRTAMLLERFRSLLDKDYLTSPPSNNAYETLLEILLIDPTNEEAKAGFQCIIDGYFELAKSSAARRDWQRVRLYAERAAKCPGDQTRLSRLVAQVDGHEAQRADSAEEAAVFDYGERDKGEEARLQEEVACARGEATNVFVDMYASAEFENAERLCREAQRASGADRLQELRDAQLAYRICLHAAHRRRGDEAGEVARKRQLLEGCLKQVERKVPHTFHLRDGRDGTTRVEMSQHGAWERGVLFELTNSNGGVRQFEHTLPGGLEIYILSVSHEDCLLLDNWGASGSGGHHSAVSLLPPFQLLELRGEYHESYSRPGPTSSYSIHEESQALPELYVELLESFLLRHSKVRSEYSESEACIAHWRAANYEMLKSGRTFVPMAHDFSGKIEGFDEDVFLTTDRYVYYYEWMLIRYDPESDRSRVLLIPDAYKSWNLDEKANAEDILAIRCTGASTPHLINGATGEIVTVDTELKDPSFEGRWLLSDGEKVLKIPDHW